MQHGQALTGPAQLGDVREQRGHPEHLPVGRLQPERRDGHHRPAPGLLEGADRLLRPHQRQSRPQHLAQLPLDGRGVLGVQEVHQAQAAQVRREPGVREEVGVGPDQPQVQVEDGQAEPVLEEQLRGERLVLPPPGRRPLRGREDEVPGRPGARAGVRERQDLEVDPQLPAGARAHHGHPGPGLRPLVGRRYAPGVRILEQVPDVPSAGPVGGQGEQLLRRARPPDDPALGVEQRPRGLTGEGQPPVLRCEGRDLVVHLVLCLPHTARRPRGLAPRVSSMSHGPPAARGRTSIISPRAPPASRPDPLRPRPAPARRRPDPAPGPGRRAPQNRPHWAERETRDRPAGQGRTGPSRRRRHRPRRHHRLRRRLRRSPRCRRRRRPSPSRRCRRARCPRPRRRGC